MNKILIIFAHPTLHRSKVNKPMLEAASSVDGVTIHNLYETYPDFDINVAREHDLLNQHAAVILHHPFFWYSCPSLLKEWLDRTLTLGWAYGPDGTALNGKVMMSAISTGGAANAYHPEGHNHYTMNQFLLPFAQTANLCGMTYVEPLIFHSASRATPQDVTLHCQTYVDRLAALRDGLPLPLFEGSRR
jgi:glutathione-regulated potassium-efflux system ancillary protein KefG